MQSNVMPGTMVPELQNLKIAVLGNSVGSDLAFVFSSYLVIACFLGSLHVNVRCITYCRVDGSGHSHRQKKP